MKIALPITNKKLSLHFGHCEIFTISEVDEESKKILSTEDVTPPPHQPGLFPEWLAERNVDLIIASGMGNKAQKLFAEQNIRAIVGVSSEDAETILTQYLNNNLQAGENSCSH